jgi:ribosome biogenesis GTPase A
VRGQWYPGNMARAMRQLKDDFKLVDLVVELLDARVPDSSRNPSLSRLIGSKRRLILLHKADRGEPEITARWLSYFQQLETPAIPFSVHTPHAVKAFYKYLNQQQSKMPPARLKRPLRLIITGIPNVGKSTLINLLVKRAAARTGNRPGVTRGRQWIRLLPGVELLDTPGVLWPALSDETAVPLAVVGALPAGGLDFQNLALWLLNVYLERQKEPELFRRYPGLKRDDPEAMLEQIGVGQGCLQAEGKIDLERAAALVLRDFQNGSLGRLSLERPPDGESRI